MHAPIARFKVVLVGNGGVGKTTFVNRLKGILDANAPYITTHAFEVNPIRVFLSNGTSIDFDIFDTAGSELIEGLNMQYYDGSHGCIAFFDLTTTITLENANSWLQAVRRVRPDIPCVLLGNKADVPVRPVGEPSPTPSRAPDPPLERAALPHLRPQTARSSKFLNLSNTWRAN